MSREALISKFAERHVNLDNIEEVDYVWNGESYLSITNKPKHYDWIIASHVIEHTPDLIGFLKDCDDVLKNTGVLSLVIPDRRYMFDRFRPLTGLGHLIDNHLQKNTIHSPGTAAEYFLNFVMNTGTPCWGEEEEEEYRMMHTLGDAKSAIDQIIETHAYLDVHEWCFTPTSFRLLMHDLYLLGFSPFKEVGFFSTVGCEFYITLGRAGQEFSMPRLQALQTIEDELFESRNHVATQLATTNVSPTANDFVFDVQNAASWTIANMSLVGGAKPNTWIVGNDPQMVYQLPLDLCLLDYSDIYVRMTASQDTKSRMQIFYGLTGKPGFSEAQSLTTPLIADGQEHEYRFDLGSIAASLDTRMTQFRFDPVRQGTSANSQVQIYDLRLIRRDQPTKCT